MSKERSRILDADASDTEHDVDNSDATRTQQQRKAAKTKKGYNSRNALFAEWCKNTVQMPLTLLATKLFLFRMKSVPLITFTVS
jgi:hypothetical protein